MLTQCKTCSCISSFIGLDTAAGMFTAIGISAHAYHVQQVSSTDTEVTQAADFAAEQLSQQSNSLAPLKVAEVLSARSKVVNGKTFELKLKLSQGSTSEQIVQVKVVLNCSPVCISAAILLFVTCLHIRLSAGHDAHMPFVNLQRTHADRQTAACTVLLRVHAGVVRAILQSMHNEDCGSCTKPQFGHSALNAQ